ncbi:AI-2E family transporter [Anaerotalea alkaliphila]|uniref:AI-2E family transporter n=1 Tax=Anaerotalea alkaliphila TaxID=2662126 RepID=A0A7X5HV22_9FIRM|nr:AI-2E family transporter [Anaerotalea alkaliphila]NDL66971.1 AI-2E family transporter [Anaerotalea alkaliphila]
MPLGYGRAAGFWSTGTCCNSLMTRTRLCGKMVLMGMAVVPGTTAIPNGEERRMMRKWMGLTAFAVFLLWVQENWRIVAEGAGAAAGILWPFVLGFALAFVVNIPMKFLEGKVLVPRGRFGGFGPRLRRALALLGSLVLILAVLLAASLLVVPEVAATIRELVERLPGYARDLGVMLEERLAAYPQVLDWVSGFETDWEGIRDSLLALLGSSAGNWLGSTFSFASSVVSGIVSFVLAFVFSIYLLLQKETLQGQLHRLLRAFLPDRWVGQLVRVAALTGRTFSGFLSGQVLEAAILGVIFFLSMSLFRFPYPLTISVLVGVMALVPILGAIVGGGVGTFLILLVDPGKALWFLVLFLVVQQLESNLIYPQVVGKAAGLPSIWILVAVAVGGSLLGVAGMLLFIPLASVFYTLLREQVRHRLSLKEGE